MMTKRRRLAEQEPVTKVVAKKRVATSSVKNSDNLVVKTRRVKTADSYTPKEDVLEESKEEVLEEPKKKKKRKPVKRKGKKPKKVIDENELQKGLLNDFAVEDSD